ncbi:MAG: TraX family protein [Cellulosilyticaceae bacterium]
MDLLKKGLTSFNIKLLALIFMTFDHIAAFLGSSVHIPIWFHWIGRVSAPLFIFMVAEGFYHTHNRKKYIIRLYLGSVFMSVGNDLMNKILPAPNNTIIMNNIFATMFLITFFLYAIELLKKRKFAFGISLICLPILATICMVVIMNTGAITLLRGFMFFIPTIITVEGGPLWIALGIGCYLLREKPIRLSIFYSILCIFSFVVVLGGGFTIENLFLLNYQWLMIFSLPFMLLYNGEKGRSMKHFFYLYYPIHCYILYAIGVLMMK